MFSGMIHCLDNRDKMWIIWGPTYTDMEGHSTNSRATGRKRPFHSKTTSLKGSPGHCESRRNKRANIEKNF